MNCSYIKRLNINLYFIAPFSSCSNDYIKWTKIADFSFSRNHMLTTICIPFKSWQDIVSFESEISAYQLYYFVGFVIASALQAEPSVFLPSHPKLLQQN